MRGAVYVCSSTAETTEVPDATELCEDVVLARGNPPDPDARGTGGVAVGARGSLRDDTLRYAGGGARGRELVVRLVLGMSGDDDDGGGGGTALMGYMFAGSA